MLRRLGRLNLNLDQLRDVIALIALGALTSPVVAATIGTATLSLTHVKAWSGFGTALPVWWLGDGMGVLLMSPLILAARNAKFQSLQSRAIEAFGLFVGTTVTSLLMFSQTLGQSMRDDVLAFVVFPFVIWAAIRFRLVGASLVCLLVAIIAVWGTAHGNGPFVKHDPVHNAILLQSFLAVLSVSGLSLAAVISERARAEDALRDLSGRLVLLQDEERRRLARELHDSTGQLLVALQMNLTVLSQRVSASDQVTADLLRDSIGVLDHVLKEVRTLSYLLYPPLLDEAGLPSALQWYIDGLAQRSNLKIDLHISADLGRLSQELETTIFRIVQECLTNIHRHSGSSVARITLSTERGQTLLRIRDEGKGVRDQLLGDPTINPSSFGVGLRGIAERVRELNGRLQIKNAKPGTIVEVLLPLRSKIQQEQNKP